MRAFFAQIDAVTSEGNFAITWLGFPSSSSEVLAHCRLVLLLYCMHGVVRLTYDVSTITCILTSAPIHTTFNVSDCQHYRGDTRQDQALRGQQLLCGR